MIPVVKRPDTICCQRGFSGRIFGAAAGVTGLVTEELLPVDLPQWRFWMSKRRYQSYRWPLTTHKTTCGLVPLRGQKENNRGVYGLQILQHMTHQHTALFSTVDRITGNQPADKKKSDLTTPESYELFKDMRRAVDNGMTHLVMEVSSQAYLKQRVYGLEFQVGAFLNISPDHIGPNEHPSFEDYLAHKMMLLDHAEQVIVNAASDQLSAC